MARHKEFSKEAALQQAMLLFWKKGFSRTSMQDLTEAMGLSRSSIYDSFENKEKLYADALELYAYQKSQKRINFVASLQANGKEKIILLFNDMIDGLYATTSPDGCLLTDSVGILPSVDASIHAFVTEQFASVRELYGELVALGKRDGSITSSLSNESLSFMLFNLHESTIVLGSVGDNDQEQRQLIQNFMDML
ncbi:TetR/AcrR family transcriptional regulator [Erysipelothrix sp. HDW6C]|uniref:TetR/AcrR family transcriptional regulator n=1 Tax=Erysipelothrix sp. HDW6C TaxID=2714930 RepID=UPI0014075F38|nr:TetR/AcrR family transcriptional regulator [Erysipelothrix sp. HDW6C]QIK70303.1 TetR/AcrR family transcriptional regulator [Erysipelothrix sp. HDW6C]